jgi:hypothetical protein
MQVTQLKNAGKQKRREFESSTYDAELELLYSGLGISTSFPASQTEV